MKPGAFSPAFEVHSARPLAELTSLRLGGPAQFFTRATAEALPEAIDWAAARGMALTLLGGGSNVVVADGGVPGLVLTLAEVRETAARDGDWVDVSVSAGESWDAFVFRAVERGWAGVECLSGIPGQVGATPIQNVGAYGQEVADTLRSVRVFDRTTRSFAELGSAECRFGYRTSRFKERDGDRFIVLDATFRLRAGGAPCFAYPEIARQFPAASGARPSLPSVRAAVLATRRSKSMLLDASDENGRSCGSFFVNPRLTDGELERLRERAPASPPCFTDAEGRHKVPAAWLIEQAGFRRGQRFGNVGISSRHSLALVCHAGASSRELVEVAHRVRDGVASAFGVWLSPEPRFLGFRESDDGLPVLGTL